MWEQGAAGLRSSRCYNPCDHNTVTVWQWLNPTQVMMVRMMTLMIMIGHQMLRAVWPQHPDNYSIQCKRWWRWWQVEASYDEDDVMMMRLRMMTIVIDDDNDGELINVKSCVTTPLWQLLNCNASATWRSLGRRREGWQYRYHSDILPSLNLKLITQWRWFFALQDSSGYLVTHWITHTY